MGKIKSKLLDVLQERQTSCVATDALKSQQKQKYKAGHSKRFGVLFRAFQRTVDFKIKLTTIFDLQMIWKVGEYLNEKNYGFLINNFRKIFENIFILNKF